MSTTREIEIEIEARLEANFSSLHHRRKETIEEGKRGGDKYFAQLFYVSKIRTNTRYLLLIIRNELNEFFFFLNFFILFFLPSVSVFIFRINSFFLTR